MLRGEHAVSEVDMRLETSGDRKSCFEAKRIATVQEKRDSEKRGRTPKECEVIESNIPRTPCRRRSQRVGRCGVQVSQLWSPSSFRDLH